MDNRLSRLWWRLKDTDEESLIEVLERLLTKDTKIAIDIDLKAALDTAEDLEVADWHLAIRGVADKLPDGDALKTAIDNVVSP